MATASTAPFEELTKLAAEFVTSQKGIWDHDAWMDFLERVQKKGIGVSEDMQSNLGELLEAMKEYHTAISSTEDIEKAMRTVFDNSVAFIQRQKGVWGHEEWEDFLSTVQQNSRTWSDGAEAYLGGVLESLKVFYSSPLLKRPQSSSPPARKKAAASPAPKAPAKPAAAAKPAPSTREAAAPAPTAAPARAAAPARSAAAPAPASAAPVRKPGAVDDLTEISGIGPAMEKKLNRAGIRSYAQIAALSDDEISHLEKDVLKATGRFKKNDWVGQARKLAGT